MNIPSGAIPEAPGEALPVAEVWAGHPVGFSLLTTEAMQYVAYYDVNRVMTVASRLLSSSTWQRTQLPEMVGWDSHNNVVLARDRNGFLHLSGNMHADPLVYFRSRKPDDIGSLERMGMTGQLEDLVTYPEFFRGPEGALCFSYRHGSSGRGDQISNRYDPATQRWERLNAGAVVSGQGVRNAYLDGPRCGPDGLFHLCWVWRDSPECSTNHTLCYARSRDLVHWETSAGTPLNTPITYDSAEVVDPVPCGVGLMNGNAKLGFDLLGRAVISYHKLDEQGCTQIFQARNKGGQWLIHALTQWKGAWLPTGEGTITPELKVHPLKAGPDGRLTLRVWKLSEGNLLWELDQESLQILRRLPSCDTTLQHLQAPADENMRVNWSDDSGWEEGGVPPFALRWESFPENRDRPMETAPAQRSVLKVIRVAGPGRAR